MFNLMIIEENPEELNKLINNICEKFKNIRISYISYDYKMTLKMLEKNTIDFILLDCKINNLNNLKLIDYIQSKQLEKYKKSIIIKIDKKINFNIYDKNKYIFSYTSDLNKMYENIKKLIVSTQKEKYNIQRIRKKIRKQLNYLNFNYCHNGTKYLEETILEIYKEKYNFDGNLSKNIYPIIAKKYNKKVDTIYGNIKQATNYMLSECNKNIIISYLGYSYYVKPKVQEIIFAILNKLE